MGPWPLEWIKDELAVILHKKDRIALEIFVKTYGETTIKNRNFIAQAHVASIGKLYAIGNPKFGEQIFITRWYLPSATMAWCGKQFSAVHNSKPEDTSHSQL